MNARQVYKVKVMLAFTLSLIWFLLLLIPASVQAVAQNKEPYRVEEFTVSGPGNLQVNTSGGHITVRAAESNRVRVEMFVTRDGRQLTSSDTDLSEFDIEISQSGNKITATARRQNNRIQRLWNNNNISVSFVVYTPEEMSSNLKTSGGHIEARGLDGNQNISTSGGHLQLSDLRGQVEARTSGGHIEIAHFKGELSARTSGGHIEVDNAQGTIDVRTSGGHIDFTGVSGTLKASTSGGSITADLAKVVESASLRTSGGNVRISVPEGIGLDLDLRGSYVQTQLSNFSGKIEHDEVEGKVNGGGPKVAARTSGGTVSVIYQ